MKTFYTALLLLIFTTAGHAQLSRSIGGTGMYNFWDATQTVTATHLSLSPNYNTFYSTIQLNDTSLTDTVQAPLSPGVFVHIFQAIAPDTATHENVIVCAKGFNGRGSTGTITLGTGVGNGVTLMSYQSPVDSKLYWATVQGDNYTVN